MPRLLGQTDVVERDWELLVISLASEIEEDPGGDVGDRAPPYLASDIRLGEPQSGLQVVLVILLDDPQDFYVTRLLLRTSSSSSGFGCRSGIVTDSNALSS